MLDGAAYVVADASRLRRTLARWYSPREAFDAQARALRTIHRSVRLRLPRLSPALVPDGGAGRSLLQSLRGRDELCAPTALPSGYSWPSADAARRYLLAAHPAVAAYATAGSGRSILWMETTWQDPPILRGPTRSVRRGGRTYDLYFESGRLRQVAWRLGRTRVWVTNTLRNEVSNRQMLALALSCSPLGA
jgi:hypothetical protein